ncbi:hypothetical protein B4135_0758 [Caldibacillus debilis]|uniref:Uncharacterized protein n=1 Tax=Caldibacillus debilis TaxID=301148 RepID=A0A150M6Y0_9BACI|nr:hypothetical protein B4135_0758 [Caldibacillus debilis]
MLPSLCYSCNRNTHTVYHGKMAKERRKTSPFLYVKNS